LDESFITFVVFELHVFALGAGLQDQGRLVIEEEGKSVCIVTLNKFSIIFCLN